MAQSKAATVDEYLAELPEERRAVVTRMRDLIRKNLPKGYQEEVGYGVICYVVPLSRYPDTYNKQPLSYAALGAQKNYNALYLTGVYGDGAQASWFREAFEKAGKKLDMGKSCVRFRALDDLPLDVIGEAIARVPPEQYIAIYEASRA